MQEPQETRVQSLGQEDPLEKGMATHSSTLAWKIPRTEEPGGLQSTGSQSQTPLKRFSVHAHTVRYFTYSTFQSGLTTFLRPCRHMWLPATIIKQCINKMYKFLLDKAC